MRMILASFYISRLGLRWPKLPRKACSLSRGSVLIKQLTELQLLTYLSHFFPDIEQSSQLNTNRKLTDQDDDIQ